MKINNYHIRDYSREELRDHILYHADLWVMEEYGNKDSFVRLFSILEPERFRASLSLRPNPTMGEEF